MNDHKSEFIYYLKKSTIIKIALLLKQIRMLYST